MPEQSKNKGPRADDDKSKRAKAKKAKPVRESETPKFNREVHALLEENRRLEKENERLNYLQHELTEETRNMKETRNMTDFQKVLQRILELEKAQEEEAAAAGKK